MFFVEGQQLLPESDSHPTPPLCFFHLSSGFLQIFSEDRFFWSVLCLEPIKLGFLRAPPRVCTVDHPTPLPDSSFQFSSSWLRFRFLLGVCSMAFHHPGPGSASGSASSSSSGFHFLNSPFGDTTLTKVFVGGLAWETKSETLRRHFEQFGEILEAVVITDKNTGRSKGYGFVSISWFFNRVKWWRLLL